MNRFSQDHDDMKLCVREFDKALCEKVNKSTLNQLAEQIRVDHVRNAEWKALEEKLIEEDKRRAAELHNEMEAFERYRVGVSTEIERLCGDAVDQKLSLYDRVAESFQRFFGQDELQQVLDRKADLELVQRLQDTKATKQEITYQSSLIDALNVRLKHMSILISEIAKSAIPSRASSSFKATENINT